MPDSVYTLIGKIFVEVARYIVLPLSISILSKVILDRTKSQPNKQKNKRFRK